MIHRATTPPTYNFEAIEISLGCYITVKINNTTPNFIYFFHLLYLEMGVTVFLSGVCMKNCYMKMWKILCKKIPSYPNSVNLLNDQPNYNKKKKFSSIPYFIVKTEWLSSWSLPGNFSSNNHYASSAKISCTVGTNEILRILEVAFLGTYLPNTATYMEFKAKDQIKSFDLRNQVHYHLLWCKSSLKSWFHHMKS